MVCLLRLFSFLLLFVSLVACADKSVVFSYDRSPFDSNGSILEPIAKSVFKPVARFTQEAYEAAVRPHACKKGFGLDQLDQLAEASSKKSCPSKPGFLLSLIQTYPLTTLWLGLTVICAAVHWNRYTKQCQKAERKSPLPENRSDDDKTTLDKTKKDPFFDCIKNAALVSAACAAFCYMLKK